MRFWWDHCIGWLHETTLPTSEAYEACRKVGIPLAGFMLSCLHTHNTATLSVPLIVLTSLFPYVRCLHSLSRSTKLLRTSIVDAEVWKPILEMLSLRDEECLVVASGVACNMLLSFSPSRAVSRINVTVHKQIGHSALSFCRIIASELQ